MVGVKDTTTEILRKLRRMRQLRRQPPLTIHEKSRLIELIVESDRETFRILAKK